MSQPKNREELLAALIERTPKSRAMWAEAQEVVPGGLLSAAHRFEPYLSIPTGGRAHIYGMSMRIVISTGCSLLIHRPLGGRGACSGYPPCAKFGGSFHGCQDWGKDHWGIQVAGISAAALESAQGTTVRV